MYGIVYELLCDRTDLRYVGQTIHTLEERWHGHCDTSLRQGLHWEISKAIRECGHDSFQRRVLCECSSKKELDVMKRKFIADLQTVWPCGYNMTNGGEGPCELTRKLISERTRIAMSDVELRKRLSALAKQRSHITAAKAMVQANRGKQRPAEVRMKISAAHEGMKHSQEAIHKMKAHKFSDEHRRKLSEAAKRWKRKSSSGESP